MNNHVRNDDIVGLSFETLIHGITLGIANFEGDLVSPWCESFGSILEKAGGDVGERVIIKDVANAAQDTLRSATSTST